MSALPFTTVPLLPLLFKFCLEDSARRTEGPSFKSTVDGTWPRTVPVLK
jgi:hypothetical protein